MALTYSTSVTSVFGNHRVRVARIAHSSTGSETTATVAAGAGMLTPIGGYTDSTLSGSTYTMTIIDGAASSYSNVLFIGG